MNPSNEQDKQDKKFYAALLSAILVSGLIAAVAQSIGGTVASQRLADPATYHQTA